MLRGEAHERGPEERVLPGGIDLDHLLRSGHGKPNDGAVAFSDPVPLHGEDPLGPSRKPVTMLQDLLGIGRDLEVPGIHLLQDHLLVRMTPATAVFHLLLGQDGLTLPAPVDMGLLLVGQALVVHFQKNELLPSIVLGITGGQLAVPIVAEPHAFQLGAHVIDVLVCPSAGMGVVFNGCILSGQPEGVPPHGVEDVFSAHPLVAGHHIADGVVSNMTHVDLSARIGEHLQEIVLFLARILLHLEQADLLPMPLPLFLHCLRIILHGRSESSCSIRRTPSIRGGERDAKKKNLLISISSLCELCVLARNFDFLQSRQNPGRFRPCHVPRASRLSLSTTTERSNPGSNRLRSFPVKGTREPGKKRSMEKTIFSTGSTASREARM